MNEQQIEILRQELVSIDWDISYHMEKLGKAQYMKSIIKDKLESIESENNLLKDYTDESKN